jgi:hypothetical protein
MPALVMKYQEKVTVTRVKKAYSVLSQAEKMARVDHGEPAEWCPDAAYAGAGSKCYRDIFAEYIKKIKSTERDYDLGYADADYPYNYAFQLDGKQLSWNVTASVISAMRLPDGTKANFFVESGNCNRAWGTGRYANICAEIDIVLDVNKPYKFGVTHFPFYLAKDGIIPVGGEGNSRNFSNLCSKNITTTYNGYGCTAWVIANDNMDYLHCDNLSWDGPIKCD